MRLGLSLSLGATRLGGAPVSLFTTADMVKELNAAYADILGVDRFRLARFTSAGTLQARLAISGVASGSYIFGGILSDYDGAQAGITARQVRFLDGFGGGVTVTAAGAFETAPVIIASGTIRIDCGADGRGARIDDFFVRAA